MVRLSNSVLFETFRTLRACGQGQCECAVYWTGPAHENLVDGVDHPIHKRSAFGYTVDDHWLTEFWKRLAASKRSVKVQVHTHPGEIVSQVGFLSIVIPNFAAADPSLEGIWIGRLEEGGIWRHLVSAQEALLIM